MNIETHTGNQQQTANTDLLKARTVIIDGEVIILPSLVVPQAC